MRLQRGVLVAFASLLACIGGAFTTPVSQVKAVASLSLPIEPNRLVYKVPAGRFLRVANNDEGESDEERAVSPTIEKLSGLVKKGVSKSTDQVRLQVWRAKKKSGEEAFALLKLNEMGFNIFDSPKLKTWMKYMTLINKEDPGQAMIASLTARYGDDVVAKMLVEAKTMPKTAQIAEKLESAQIQAWTKKHETVDDVFTLLKLDETGENLFRSPQFSSWVAFATNSAPKNPEVPIMMSLSPRYSDKYLASMIEPATKVPRTENIATKLQADLLTRWHLNRKSSDDILLLLNLNKGGEGLIASPEFNTWAIYTAMISKKDPEVSMISTLTTHYGDEALSAILETSKKVRETKAMATDLQNAQFKNWLAQEFTPTQVLHLLGMQNGLREPNAIVWYVYNTFYESAKAAKHKRH